VPCELWFFDKAKPAERRDRVLMIDARGVYRKVTRKIYDFSPEQTQNLSAIVWLYRGQQARFLKLVRDYLETTVQEAADTAEPLQTFWQAFSEVHARMQPFVASLPQDAAHADTAKELQQVKTEVEQDIRCFGNEGRVPETTNAALRQAAQTLAPLAEQSRELIKQLDLLYKLVGRLSDLCEQDLNAKDSDLWPSRDIAKAAKFLDEARKAAVEQLKQVRYWYRQAHWLQERFPDAELRDVEGLVKLVSLEEIERNDWSLTPGRYVGVAPEEEDEDFDFEEALREIHVELADLNTEAQQLAAAIAKNFEELGV
jgi:type I restriction enzyme M protein